MEREKRILYFEKICNKLKNKDINQIENILIEYIKSKKMENVKLSSEIDQEIYDVFLNEKFPIDIEYIIEFFEYLLDKDKKNENGIVFTPKYISDFIIDDCLKNIDTWNTDIKIIDPGCGCGIFLISALEYIYKKFKIPVQQIIEESIYGIDIMEDNIRRCKLAIELYCVINDIEIKNDIKFNLIHRDSLKEKWTNLFNVNNFDYIVGNPPYVNPHDMNKATVKFLKENFKSTRDGVFNIFYAFIENGLKYLKEDGALEYIIPNNVLTIKSAVNLREILQKENNIETIIDFSDNMLFKPVRTYNCIIKLNKNNNTKFGYAVLDKCNNVEKKIKEIKYQEMDISLLDKNGWNLVDEKVLNNIKKIENQEIPIKEFIRTGIATLKDGIYLVNCDENGFYKEINGKRYNIETTIVKPIYKIPELKKCENENDAMQYIIFPYIKHNGSYTLINEEDLKKKYPNTYQYLLEMKSELDKRDKGKKNPYGWYAYGRTQGLNKYGKKMLFPTFAKQPKFRYIENENALFCNGYAIFENDKIDLIMLGKILNSDLMKYYISNTSYPIEGGYYCYQKKYIEKFSIPQFTNKELEILKNENSLEINKMLFRKYDIII